MTLSEKGDIFRATYMYMCSTQSESKKCDLLILDNKDTATQHVIVYMFCMYFTFFLHVCSGIVKGLTLKALIVMKMKFLFTFSILVQTYKVTRIKKVITKDKMS